jgi:lysyl-tRNA synthetase class 2
MIASGFDRIFQICKCFRRGERGPRHLPELTLLEWYGRGDTYLDLMDQCTDLIRHVASETGTGNTLAHGSATLDLSGPWQRLTVEEAFRLHAGVPLGKALETGTFDEVVAFEIEPFLGSPGPTFLMDYPARMAALSRLKPGSGEVAERFELYMAGIELANGFTELTDAGEQRRRFEIEQGIRKASGKPDLPLPEPFLKSLETMPPTAGIALGIDRLVMIFTNTSLIDEVVAFSPEEL